MATKILIVDDEPESRSYLMTVLEDHGYECITADNGKSGLDLTRKEKPALITLDLIMPEQSGIMMFQELRKDPALSDIPVVIISGASEVTGVDFRNFIFKQPLRRKDRQAVEQSGGTRFSGPNAFIEKPVDPDELIRVIRETLKS